jgi:hypothetical protein
MFGHPQVLIMLSSSFCFKVNVLSGFSRVLICFRIVMDFFEREDELVVRVFYSGESFLIKSAISFLKTGERSMLDVNRMSFMRVLISFAALSMRNETETTALSVLVRVGSLGDFI